MLIKIYSKPGCKFCDYAKELFERANVTWEEIVCTGDNEGVLSRDYPEANSYPHIIIDGEVIGGLNDTCKYFLKNGLIVAPKNERS